MGRVAVLKIGNGVFDQGFDVSLQVCRDNALPSLEIPGRLPANTEFKGLYTLWQETFVRLRTQRGTDSDWQIETRPTNYSTSEVDTCRDFVRKLETNMKNWLQRSQDEGWLKIREILVRELASTSDEFRMIITAKNSEFCKLPWHTWDLMESNPNVEIAFSYPSDGESELSETNYNNQVRILAILGDSSGIDTQPDRDAIKRLNDAKSVFLSQPTSRELIKYLRKPEGWDIFFFAGHSETNGEIGRIYINEGESLEISDFKNALKEAIRYGLKLAIFNSCDGLGLAQQLADLHIPVIIVMREPVPDKVAQSFLKEFLTEYAEGKPLYTSVRRARERLEEFQDLPGATWLPVICQNPVKVPPTWQQLREPIPDEVAQSISNPPNVGTTLPKRTNSTRQWLLLQTVFLSALLTLLQFFPKILPFFLESLPFHTTSSLPLSSFQNSCDTISIVENKVSAECTKSDGSKNPTSIKVTGIRNHDGKLEFLGFNKHSNFQDPNECERISLAKDVISGYCRRNDGSYNKTSIKVPGIHNHDGKLGINKEDKHKFSSCNTFKIAKPLFYLCR